MIRELGFESSHKLRQLAGKEHGTKVILPQRMRIIWNQLGTCSQVQSKSANIWPILKFISKSKIKVITYYISRYFALQLYDNNEQDWTCRKYIWINSL